MTTDESAFKGADPRWTRDMLALSAFLIAYVLVASHRTVSRVPTLAVAHAYVAWHQATLSDAVGVVRAQRDKQSPSC